MLVLNESNFYLFWFLLIFCHDSELSMEKIHCGQNINNSQLELNRLLTHSPIQLVWQNRIMLTFLSECH